MKEFALILFDAFPTGGMRKMTADSGASESSASSEILRLAALLRDEGRTAAIGSRMIRQQIEAVAGQALGTGPGPASWYDEWENLGNTWSNWVDTDEWPDAKGRPSRPEFLGRPAMRFEAQRGMPGRQAAGRRPCARAPELVFNDEELQVLKDLGILD